MATCHSPLTLSRLRTAPPCVHHADHISAVHSAGQIL